MNRKCFNRRIHLAVSLLASLVTLPLSSATHSQTFIRITVTNNPIIAAAGPLHIGEFRREKSCEWIFSTNSKRPRALLLCIVLLKPKRYSI